MSKLDNLIAAQATQPPERIPNTQPGTQYPRWMRPTGIFPEGYAAAQGALTVDTHAIVHAAAVPGSTLTNKQLGVEEEA